MSQARRDRGAAARLSGRRAEWTAALWLMLKGYRILGFRLKTRQGEVDLLALKGRGTKYTYGLQGSHSELSRSPSLLALSAASA